MMRLRTLLTVAWLAVACATQAQTVTLNGQMGSRQALLVIDGQPRVVEVGATVQGVRLLSLSGTQADVEVGGQRRVLLAGASQVRVGGGESAKKIQLLVKQSKLKVQAAIQGDVVRVSGAKRDDLQQAIAMLRREVSDLPLTFTNFRE